MKLLITGKPEPKQSARHRIVKGKGKTFVSTYQKKEVKQREKSIALQAKAQLPKGFKLYDEPIGVIVLFVFPPLKSFTKSQHQALEAGQILYKDKKPDLTDNLMKGLFDALEGVVFTNDSRVCKVESMKIFGKQERTELEFYKLNTDGRV